MPFFLWEVSERPLLRDVGKMHLKYDGLSPTVIGNDLILHEHGYKIEASLGF